MSIFKKASELDNIPSSINEALFENHDFSTADEFDGLIVEASNNRSVYENRLKSFKKAQSTQSESYEFTKPQPSKYDNLPGGIRRIGEGQRFADEQSELFGSQNNIRSTEYDNNKYAESLLNNGFSIWESEFDDLQNAFDSSQKQTDVVFDRRTSAEKKASSNLEWEKNQLQQLRKSNILPYRDHAVSRFANERPPGHGKFGSVNEFYAQAQDDIRGFIRQSNEDRKTHITRKGVDPEERRDAWENKEAISARTMEALENNSFLAKFAEGFSLDD